MSAAHTAQLWALEHILDAGVDTDVIDEIIPIIPEDLPPRLKSRLSLALLRNALRDGSPVSVTHCKLLAKIRHPRHLTDDDPESQLYADIFAAVLLDAPDWDTFGRTFALHRDQLFPDGCPSPLAHAAARLASSVESDSLSAAAQHIPAIQKYVLRPDQIRDKVRACADALRERLGGTSLDRVVADAEAGRYHVRAEAPDELLAGLNLPPAWMRARERVAAADARARDPPRTPPRAAAVGTAVGTAAAAVAPVAGSPGRKPMLRTPPSAKRRRVQAPAARVADETETVPMDTNDPFAFEWREMGDAAEEVAAAAEKKARATPTPVPSGDAAAPSPVTRVMNALLPWRRGGGGVGEDRGASPRSTPGKRKREDDDDDDAYAPEDVMPTQAAPDEEEEEAAAPAPRGILSRMFSLGRRASAAPAALPAPAAPASPVGSPGASTPPESPGRIRRTPRRMKEKKPRKLGPLGKANRHSKRALKEGADPRPKIRVRWTEEETEVLRAGVEKWGKGKWKEIYAEHEAFFASRERTLTDMKDRWRNMQKVRSTRRAPAPERDAAPVAGGGSPRWRRFLGFAADGGEGEDDDEGAVAAAAERPPRAPGVANRHSAFRKKIGVDLGVRKPRQAWTVDEELALEEGVELFGHHDRDKWARILKHFDDVFVNRTSVDLKDKYRNITMKRAREEIKARLAAQA